MQVTMCVHIYCRDCIVQQGLQALERQQVALKCSLCRRPLASGELMELKLPAAPAAASAPAPAPALSAMVEDMRREAAASQAAHDATAAAATAEAQARNRARIDAVLAGSSPRHPEAANFPLYNPATLATVGLSPEPAPVDDQNFIALAARYPAVDPALVRAVQMELLVDDVDDKVRCAASG